MTFYELIKADLVTQISLDPKLRSIRRKIEAGGADLTDTAAYSSRVSDLLGEIFAAHVTEETAPGVREYVCRLLLREQYEEINTLLFEVQEVLDEAQGLHLNPIKAPFPAERVQQLAHSLEDPGVPAETIMRRANTGTANVSRSFHDDYIMENARVRNDLGLKCYVTRTGSSKACKWCAEMFGKYRFGEVPKDIFRRHDNCNCTIVYDNQVLRGKVEADGRRSRSWEVIGEELPREYQPTVLTREQAIQLEQEQLNRFWMAAENSKLKAKYPKTIVDKPMLSNPMYHKLFDAFGEDEKTTRKIFQSARDALSHRSGTKFEDLIYIDSLTGRTLSRTDYDKESEVIPSKRMKQMVLQAPPGTVISIHNHPESGVPSIVDIRTAHDRKYKYGVVACHNGNLFQYRTTGEFDDNFVDSLLDKLHRIVYNTNEDTDAVRLQRDLDQTLELLRKNNVDLKVILWQ